MFGAGSFVVTYSILTAIVASFPPEVDGVPNTHTSAQRAGIAMIFMTSIFFSVSFGPVSWVLASEVFPTKTRSIGTSGMQFPFLRGERQLMYFPIVATCANWLFNILFSQVSNLAINNISWKFYLLFIILNFIDFIIIALFFPETKGTLSPSASPLQCSDHVTGKSLEEMATLFGDEVQLPVSEVHDHRSDTHSNEKV